MQEFEFFKSSINKLIIEHGDAIFSFKEYNPHSARSYARSLCKKANVIIRTTLSKNVLKVNISTIPRKVVMSRMRDSELNTKIENAVKSGGSHDFKCEKVSAEVLRCRILRFARKHSVNVQTKRFGSTITLIVGEKRRFMAHNTKITVINVKTGASYEYTRYNKHLKYAALNEKKRLVGYFHGVNKHFKNKMNDEVKAVIDKVPSKDFFNESVIKVIAIAV